MPKFVPRERKHRKLAKQKAEIQNEADVGVAAPEAEANALELDARKAKLKSTLVTPEHRMSSKKKKRLDKYLSTKLRKEDTLALIRRLEAKHKDVDRSLLQSSSKLGRQHDTKREAFVRALKEKQRNVRVVEAEKVLYQGPSTKRQPDVAVNESESEGESSEDEEHDQNSPKTSEVPLGVVHGPELSNASTLVEASELKPKPGSDVLVAPAVSTFGSGLKRPLDLDENGRPIIQTRKRRRKGPLLLNQPTMPESEDLEWTGFSGDENVSARSKHTGHDMSDDEATISEDSSDEEMSSEEDEDQAEDEVDDASEGSLDASASDDESDHSNSYNAPQTARTSAFKAWAEQQRNEAIGFRPSNALETNDISEAVKKNFTPRAVEEDPLPQSLQIPASSQSQDRKVCAVSVERTEEIQVARRALPVLAEEQRIMESIHAHDVVIISGATGSGKTTQIPQFLYESGFGSPNSTTPGMIGITQPRRVAAVSMAKRVAEELGDHGAKVGYQIRFDTSLSKGTAVKFMTDGVLLREMSQDFSLKKYSAIVIDEAHERTVNTDILISLLSRCITIRRTLAKEQSEVYQPLKLVIMSATLRISDFKDNRRLFSLPPPVVEVEGRQYDVTIHWARRTGNDFVEEAFKKVTRGHRKLPPGGMLVFLTGQQDIKELMRRLRDVFEITGGDRRKQLPVAQAEASKMVLEDEDMDAFGDPGGLQRDIDTSADDVAGSDVEDGDPDAEFIIEGGEPPAESTIPKIHLLPLYSQLPSTEQLKVFQPPPPNSRLIILATNVAETSLTIPGIRYVFDCGRHKERLFSSGSGVSQFRTTWISKASANQRSGRAGRTGPGHCWRLYSSAVYEDAMPEFAEPEIRRAGLESVVLQLKGLGVEKVGNFPWVSEPILGNVVKAEKALHNLGAIDFQGKITSIGRELSNYPLSPRFAQMLRLGIAHSVAAETIALVASLDVPELIIPQSQLDLSAPSRDENAIWTAEDEARETARETRRKEYAAAMAGLSRLDSDPKKVRAQADALRSFAALLDYPSEEHERYRYCREHYLREKGLREAQQLREQLTAIVRSISPSTILPAEIKKPSAKVIAMLKQIVAAGFLDQIAIRADFLPSPPIEDRKPKRAIDVKYRPLFSVESTAMIGEGEEEDEEWVYIHPSSLLSRLPPNQTPRYIVYHTLQRSSRSRPGEKSRIRMLPLTPVSGEQMAVLARGTALLDIGKPVGKVQVLERSARGEERRECEVVLSLIGDKGMLGWPLCRKRVVQKRVVGRGWEVEKWL